MHARGSWRRPAYATDHAGREVFLNAVGRGRGRRTQEARFELLAMGAVIDPLARGHDPLARGNGGSMAHHSHDVAMAARPRAQHAEAVLSVAVGHSLDKARPSSSPASGCGLMWILFWNSLSPCDQAITGQKNS